MGNNKFWKGVCWGALIGGAVTLFDKQTRKDVANSGRKIAGAIKNPKQTAQKVKTIVRNLQDAYENIRDDVTYISDKLYELKDVPTRVTDIITESKKVVEGKGPNFNQTAIQLHSGKEDNHTDTDK
ncbi:MAG TPA: YtxH domain-containing protein [Bacillus sp. (in: firmicutes)]|nr:YtxH domain-containing protein [Bacillus sp. (in: firmicutes)]